MKLVNNIVDYTKVCSMKDVIKEITQKDDSVAYAKTKEIVSASEFSRDYYPYLDDFALLLNNEKSYIRTRAFILCCSQARWDDGKIKNILPSMVKLLNDPKPTVVRQCLNAIKEVVVYCPELCRNILESLEKIDLTKYKESMTPLIKKDIESLTELINEQLHY